MILNTKTGKLAECYFKKIERNEITTNNYNPSGGWDFNWLKPLTHGFEIYGIVTKEYPELIQGLIALKPNCDEDFLCVDVDIIESAPMNKKMIKKRKNTNRKYIGVGRCLTAFACQYSIDVGLKGFVELMSKTTKINFYENLGAKRSHGQNMIFDDKVAHNLVSEYFPGGVKWW